MNLYSRALRHIDMKDVKESQRKRHIKEKLVEKFKKHHQKTIDSLMEGKRYDWRKELNEQMTSSGVFFTTLPPTGATEYPAIELSTTTVSFPGYNDASLVTYDSSYYNELIYDVTIDGDTALIIELGGSIIEIVQSSGTYSLSVPQSKNLQVLLSIPDNATGVVRINDTRFRRTTPLNVFVPLDAPEASSFVRVGSGDLSPEERKQKLNDMLDASDEYVTQVLGTDFPGSGSIRPGEAGITPGIEISQIPLPSAGEPIGPRRGLSPTGAPDTKELPGPRPPLPKMNYPPEWTQWKNA